MNYELKLILNQMSEKLILLDKCPDDGKILLEYKDYLTLLNQYSERLNSKED